METCRLMQEKAGLLRGRGALTLQLAAMTKLHISEVFLDSSMDAFKICGGVSYLEGSQAGGNFRDTLGGVIYSGTSDVNRKLISRLRDLKHR